VDRFGRERLRALSLHMNLKRLQITELLKSFVVI
jgi:hypothetical protein